MGSPLTVASSHVKPLCPVFGLCGGCSYQDIPYQDELKIKHGKLEELLQHHLGLDGDVLSPVVPSPKQYHYRNRLDLGLLRTGNGNIVMGFQPQNRFRVISTDSCAIAMEGISEFLPELKSKAAERLPARYRIANLVVRTDEAGHLHWGGIGRRSLRLAPKDYFWTEPLGKRIFYSLDTFFQPNLSILPLLLRRVEELLLKHEDAWLIDLYAGVGLFGILLADRVKKVILVEENTASVELARFNRAYHGLVHVDIRPGRVEERLPCVLEEGVSEKKVIFVDPPRRGLSHKALQAIAGSGAQWVIYLSCQPESLVRDLKGFIDAGWLIESITPFDFFPKTKHIETLTILRPR